MAKPKPTHLTANEMVYEPAKVLFAAATLQLEGNHLAAAELLATVNPLLATPLLFGLWTGAIEAFEGFDEDFNANEFLQAMGITLAVASS